MRAMPCYVSISNNNYLINLLRTEAGAINMVKIMNGRRPTHLFKMSDALCLLLVTLKSLLKTTSVQTRNSQHAIMPTSPQKNHLKRFWLFQSPLISRFDCNVCSIHESAKGMPKRESCKIFERCLQARSS